MNRDLAKVFHSEQAKSLSPTSILVYCLMLTDVFAQYSPGARACKGSGMLISDIGRRELEMRCGGGEGTRRLPYALRALIEAGWIKEVSGGRYSLGETKDGLQWYALGEKKTPRTAGAEKVLAAARRGAERLAKEAKEARKRRAAWPRRRAAREELKTPALSVFLSHRFRELFGATFKTTPSDLPTRKMQNIYMHQFSKYLDENEEECEAFLVWFFTRWDDICTAWGIVGHRPRMRLLASKRMVQQLQKWRTSGFKARESVVADRADAEKITAAKDRGW